MADPLWEERSRIDGAGLNIIVMTECNINEAWMCHGYLYLIMVHVHVQCMHLITLTVFFLGGGQSRTHINICVLYVKLKDSYQTVLGNKKGESVPGGMKFTVCHAEGESYLKKIG